MLNILPPLPDIPDGPLSKEGMDVHAMRYALIVREADRANREPLGWISVQDRLPPEGVMVATLAREKRSTTGYAISYGEWNNDDGDGFRNMCRFKSSHTHWLELPAHPPSHFKKHHTKSNL